MAAKFQLSYIVTAVALMATGSVLAHGYINMPVSSRAYQCVFGSNTDCRAIQGDIQSLEAGKGFPELGPVDGKIASAGFAKARDLDAQTSTRWNKTEVQAGPFNIEWVYTAPHRTAKWRYFLTKQNWNTDQPLTRDSFDLTPFCEIDGRMQAANQTPTHQCTLPERTGYQVILGVWDVGDTGGAFYNVMDVKFKDGGQPPSQWSQSGAIAPTLDLSSGDKVKTRVFDTNSSERPELQTTLTIANDNQGQKNQWAYELASKINKDQTLIQAGQKDSNNQFTPVYGNNPIYLKSGSGLSRVEIDYELQQPPIESGVSVSGLANSYPLDDGKVRLEFTVSAQGKYSINATLYNHDGRPQANGMAVAYIDDNSQPLTMQPRDLKAGHHQLIVIATPQDGGELIQQTFDMMLDDLSDPVSPSGDYQFTFPEGLSSYTAGTKVFQPKTSKVYQCKPYPYSGYCQQWATGATQYEPGIGSHWQSAWDEVK